MLCRSSVGDAFTSGRSNPWEATRRAMAYKPSWGRVPGSNPGGPANKPVQNLDCLQLSAIGRDVVRWVTADVNESKQIFAPEASLSLTG